jgi:hypothetical protein
MMKRPPVPAPPHRGGCLCGAVRYRVEGPPLATVACHCRDCQKLTGATNLLTIYFDRADFHRDSGDVIAFRKRADSGREADYYRCVNCGTRLWHQPLAASPWIMVAAGTLDDPSWVVPAAHIWVSRAAPSASIPDGVARWDKGPADRTELVAAFSAVQQSR